MAFYAKMKPDAAAQQVAAMDEDIAAALLMKLEPKVASLVLAEIEAGKAAKLAGIISGLSKVAASKKQKAASAAPPPGSARRTYGACGARGTRTCRSAAAPRCAIASAAGSAALVTTLFDILSRLLERHCPVGLVVAFVS